MVGCSTEILWVEKPREEWEGNYRSSATRYVSQLPLVSPCTQRLKKYLEESSCSEVAYETFHSSWDFPFPQSWWEVGKLCGWYTKKSDRKNYMNVSVNYLVIPKEPFNWDCCISIRANCNLWTCGNTTKTRVEIVSDKKIGSILPCVCLAIDHRWLQNELRKKKSRKRRRRVSLMLLPHFDIFCDVLLNRITATWNLFV